VVILSGAEEHARQRYQAGGNGKNWHEVNHLHPAGDLVGGHGILGVAAEDSVISGLPQRHEDERQGSRKPDPENPHENGRPESEVTQAEPHKCATANKNQVYENQADHHLTDHRSECRTTDPQVQPEDEHRVEDDVQYHATTHEHHGPHGITLTRQDAPEKRRHH